MNNMMTLLICDIQTIKEKRKLSYRELSKESYVHRCVLWKFLHHESKRISFVNLDRLLRYRKKWEHVTYENTRA